MTRLHEHARSGFATGADDRDKYYFTPLKCICATFLRVMTNHLWLTNIYGIVIMALWGSKDICKLLMKALTMLQSGPNEACYNTHQKKEEAASE